MATLYDKLVLHYETTTGRKWDVENPAWTIVDYYGQVSIKGQNAPKIADIEKIDAKQAEDLATVKAVEAQPRLTLEKLEVLIIALEARISKLEGVTK